MRNNRVQKAKPIYRLVSGDLHVGLRVQSLAGEHCVLGLGQQTVEACCC